MVGEMLFVEDDSTVFIRPLDTDDYVSIAENVSSIADYPPDYLSQRLDWARQQLPGLLSLLQVPGGRPVAAGKDLRILTVGDSITVGYLSNQDGGDGNGYRLKLQDDLPCGFSSTDQCALLTCFNSQQRSFCWHSFNDRKYVR